MSAIQKYKLYSHEIEAGEYTQIQIMRMTGIPRETLIVYEEQGKTYKDRWRFEKLSHEDSEQTRQEKMKALEGWDDARFRLNPKAKGCEQYAKER